MLAHLLVCQMKSLCEAHSSRNCRTFDSTHTPDPRAAQWSQADDHCDQTETGDLRRRGARRLFASTAGLFRPCVYISKRLPEDLECDVFPAVLFQESGHPLQRDGLRKLSARMLSFARLPGTRRLLMLKLGLAIEQSCDTYAASSLNDRLSVAGAIVTSSRLSSLPQIHDDVVSAFGAHFG